MAGRMLPCLVATAVACLAPPAFGAAFSLVPGQASVGGVGTYVTREPDTLLDVARRYDLGYAQLVAANRGVDPWLPGAKHRVVLPSFYLLPDAPRRGIVINVAALRLFYYPPDSGRVETFPIGAAVTGDATPLGATFVAAKEAAPTWYPPASIRSEQPDLPKAIPPGPDDPLGAFALHLGWPGYLIHGTNKPYGVGRDVSHGCIRLYPEDILKLFAEVAVGTPVRVVDQPVEVGWIGGRLYVAVYPSREEVDALDIGAKFITAFPPNLVARVSAAAGDQANRIDWSAVRRAGLERTGIPTPVTGPLGPIFRLQRINAAVGGL